MVETTCTSEQKNMLANVLAEAIVNALNAIAPNDDCPNFPNGSVPVKVVAAIYEKDECWVRAGIIAGWLPIGRATRDGKVITDIKQMDSKHGRISYYISPKKFWEDTGFIWRGERTADEVKKRRMDMEGYG